MCVGSNGAYKNSCTKASGATDCTATELFKNKFRIRLSSIKKKNCEIFVAFAINVVTNRWAQKARLSWVRQITWNIWSICDRQAILSNRPERMIFFCTMLRIHRNMLFLGSLLLPDHANTHIHRQKVPRKYTTKYGKNPILLDVSLAEAVIRNKTFERIFCHFGIFSFYVICTLLWWRFVVPNLNNHVCIAHGNLLSIIVSLDWQASHIYRSRWRRRRHLHRLVRD